MATHNDNKVKIFFKYGGQVIQLPVNPEELRIITSGSNQTQEVVTLGEVNILRAPKLSEVGFESFFPISDSAPYVLTKGSNFKNPKELIEFFEQPFINKEPMTMVISGLAGSFVDIDSSGKVNTPQTLSGILKGIGANLKAKFLGTSRKYDSSGIILPKSITKLVSIENFETSYSTDFDTNYKLDLKEFRNYGTRQYKIIASVDEKTGIASAPIPEKTRLDNVLEKTVKAVKVANRAVRTVNRVAGMAKKTVNTAKSAGTFIKTVTKK